MGGVPPLTEPAKSSDMSFGWRAKEGGKPRVEVVMQDPMDLQTSLICTKAATISGWLGWPQPHGQAGELPPTLTTVRPPSLRKTKAKWNQPAGASHFRNGRTVRRGYLTPFDRPRGAQARPVLIGGFLLLDSAHKPFIPIPEAIRILTFSVKLEIRASRSPSRPKGSGSFPEASPTSFGFLV